MKIDANLNTELKDASFVKGFDASHINTTDTHLEIEQVRYCGTGDLDVKVKQMSFKEQSGLVVNKAMADVKMDSTQLNVKQLVLETDESDVQLSYRMDMNAFEAMCSSPIAWT